MCGIVGIVAGRMVSDDILAGLQRLEYRGYDSAGIATLVNGHIHRRRSEGKLANLAKKLMLEPLPGNIGIGHTRWATHGRPTEDNAHPHATDKVAVVHNGIIENYRELREMLETKQHHFYSETDTETIAVLLTDFLQQGLSPQDAVKKALPMLHGAFALAMIFTGHHLLIAARHGAPLALGFGGDELFVGSDSMALAGLADKLCYLDDGDWAVLEGNKATIFDQKNNVVERPQTLSSLTGNMIGKGQFRHFMLKEIFEQPQVVGDTINAYVSVSGDLTLPPMPFDWVNIQRLTIASCGTAYYAGMVAKYWFEKMAGLPVELDVASEFRYRQGPMIQGGAVLAVSQSGETADTLAALQYAKQHQQKILAVLNVPHSSMGRLADVVVPTLAGPEIGVASTKAYVTQLVVLFCMAVGAGLARGAITHDDAKKFLLELRHLPARMNDVLQGHEKYIPVGHDFAARQHLLYLGRNLLYPLALEGALKLKEISYVHAEGFAAGEMKHGPIALIDEQVPVVMLAHKDILLEKTISNLQEVMARGAPVCLIADEATAQSPTLRVSWKMPVPHTIPELAPMLFALPVQLLAYYTAVAKGTDVDQPRNLAKSVTVE